MKIIDKIVDWLIEKLYNYKLKRRMEDIRKKDPFIYP